MKLGIIGAGWIAAKMARTVNAMPLDETLAVMQLMDRFRKDVGVRFPMD